MSLKWVQLLLMIAGIEPNPGPLPCGCDGFDVSSSGATNLKSSMDSLITLAQRGQVRALAFGKSKYKPKSKSKSKPKSNVRIPLRKNFSLRAYGYSMSKPAAQRHVALERAASDESTLAILRRVNALRTLNKRKPDVFKVLDSDVKFMQKLHKSQSN